MGFLWEVGGLGEVCEGVACHCKVWVTWNNCFGALDA